MAKLRHSVHEQYDYILADLFRLDETPAGYLGEVYVDEVPREVGVAFDRMLVESGYDLSELQFVEGLLFVSMLPLHHGHPRHQKMMYLTGLSLLNEVL